MDTLTKLGILADAAKYDAACTSSGVERPSKAGMVGNVQLAVVMPSRQMAAVLRC